MTSPVSIVDYGVGNLQSVRNAFLNIGAEPVMAKQPEDILAAVRLVLPGVGAAGAALERLRAHGLEEPLNEAVRERGVPILGICVGMQMMANTLHEFGDYEGLGWLPGEVLALRGLVDGDVRIPHMGWNGVIVRDFADDLFFDVRGHREFYFAHSYAMRLQDDAAIAATAEYGIEFAAAVKRDNIFATQFHPEKSQVNGERLLGAFVDWTP